MEKNFVAAKILVVDDMATNRKLLAHYLKEPEYHLAEAVGGTQALAVLRHESFD